MNGKGVVEFQFAINSLDARQVNKIREVGDFQVTGIRCASLCYAGYLGRFRERQGILGGAGCNEC